MSSELLQNLAEILLNRNTDNDRIRAIILCHRLLFPPDKFLEVLFQRFINQAEDIVTNELAIQSKRQQQQQQKLQVFQNQQKSNKLPLVAPASTVNNPLCARVIKIKIDKFSVGKI